MTIRSAPARAFIIHGYSATPADRWFRWLAEELETAGSPTVVPALPNPDAPDRQQWLDVLAAEVGIPDHNTILIAHSLGCLTALRYLSSLSEPWNLGSLVLVSGFLDPLPALPDLDVYIVGGCDVRTIGDHVERITVIRSDQDPYVPTTHTDRLAQQLGVTAHVIDGAGHFLASDGIDTLPEILPFIGRRPENHRGLRGKKLQQRHTRIFSSDYPSEGLDYSPQIFCRERVRFTRRTCDTGDTGSSRGRAASRTCRSPIAPSAHLRTFRHLFSVAGSGRP